MQRKHKIIKNINHVLNLFNYILYQMLYKYHYIAEFGPCFRIH